jgi:hypothetical protein
VAQNQADDALVDDVRVHRNFGAKTTPKNSGAIAASMRRVSMGFNFRLKFARRLNSLSVTIRRLGARWAI